MPDQLVTVATFWNVTEAHIARNSLASAGLTAVLANEESVGMAWHLSNGIGGVEVRVLERDAEAAIGILENGGDPSADSDWVEGADDHLATDDTDDPVTEAFSTAREDSVPDGPRWGVTGRDRLAERAFRGAVFGLALLPLQFYVFGLLLQVYVSEEPLGAASRRKAFLAAVINVPVVLLLSVGVASFFLN